MTAAEVAGAIPFLNSAYASSRIKFVFDPATDFESVASTLLNQRDQPLYDPSQFTDPATPPPTSSLWTDAAKRQKADENRGKATIFFSRPLVLAYDVALGQWGLVPFVGARGSSGHFGRFVRWEGSMRHPLLAHELGHYLHNEHPFVSGIETVAEAEDFIEAEVAAGKFTSSNALQALDGDSFYVNDTPPDAAGSIFEDVYGEGNKCGPDGTVTLSVNFGSGPQQLLLAPNRDLALSYFMGCDTNIPYLSPDQGIRARDALEQLNRRSLVSTPAGTTLVPLGTAAGSGTITDVEVARIGLARIVTLSGDGSNLKLIVWDVSATGTILRRGDIVVGSYSGAFAVAGGGLNQVIVAHRTGTGAFGPMVLKSYALDSAGVPSLSDTETSVSVGDIALRRVSPIRFVTLAQRPSQQQEMQVWRISAKGDISSYAVLNTPGASLGVSTYVPEGDAVYGGLVSFAEDTAGNLSVSSWELSTAGSGVPTLYPVDSIQAGGTNGLSVAELDFDLAASAVLTTNNQQKVILWGATYGGILDRRGDVVAGSCSRLAAAPIGVENVVTSCRESSTDDLVVRLFKVTGGQSIALAATLSPLPDVTDVALVSVRNDMVVSAARTAAGALSLRSFRLGSP